MDVGVRQLRDELSRHLAKVRDGDPEKLGLLYERYKRPLLGFFIGMVRDRELGEDLVQNTFVRILKYKHLFRGDGDFRTWMFHIARNVKNDHFRKNKMVHEKVEKWEEKIEDKDSKISEWQSEDEQRRKESHGQNAHPSQQIRQRGVADGMISHRKRNDDAANDQQPNAGERAQGPDRQCRQQSPADVYGQRKDQPQRVQE